MGRNLPSGLALSSATRCSMSASASAHVARMRSARETGVSTGFAVLDLSLIIVRQLAAEAVVNLPGFINPAADVGFLPGVSVLAPHCGIFVLASIGADSGVFLLSHVGSFLFFGFDGLGIGCRL